MQVTPPGWSLVVVHLLLVEGAGDRSDEDDGERRDRPERRGSVAAPLRHDHRPVNIRTMANAHTHTNGIHIHWNAR